MLPKMKRCVVGIGGPADRGDPAARHSHQPSVWFSYVEQESTSELLDIKTHNAEIGCIVARQMQLRTAIDAIVADLEGGHA